MKTYSDVLILLKESGKSNLYVAVIYPTGSHEWLPVDKTEYIRQLALIEPQSAKSTPYPCWFEVEKDGEMYIHPKTENR
jgi:hypothetical protein